LVCSQPDDCPQHLLEKRETEKRIRKLERISGLAASKGESGLMDARVERSRSLRKHSPQAMAKRLSMDDMAAAIIHANELLQYVQRCI